MFSEDHREPGKFVMRALRPDTDRGGFSLRLLLQHGRGLLHATLRHRTHMSGRRRCNTGDQ